MKPTRWRLTISAVAARVGAVVDGRCRDDVRPCESGQDAPVAQRVLVALAEPKARVSLSSATVASFVIPFDLIHDAKLVKPR